MIELLEAYTIKDIAIFIILIAIAAKECSSFFSWARKEISNLANSQNEKRELEEKIEENKQTIYILLEENKKREQNFKDLSDKINMLIESDVDDIKAYLTKEHHHYCYEEGWIDDYSLECCERRYKHYKDEGGNSFISSFMEELRKLPRHPPEMDLNHEII